MSVYNDSDARKALNEQHKAVADTLRQLAASLQSITGDWDGPVKDGFAAFQRNFAQWCGDGATYYEAMGKQHLTIDNWYNDVANKGSSAVNSSDVTN
jgi:uncharacterized protein YukE